MNKELIENLENQTHIFMLQNTGEEFAISTTIGKAGLNSMCFDLMKKYIDSKTVDPDKGFEKLLKLDKFIVDLKEEGEDIFLVANVKDQDIIMYVIHFILDNIIMPFLAHMDELEAKSKQPTQIIQS